MLLWRLLAERRGISPKAIAQIDRRAHRFVGLSLFALAFYIAVDASMALINHEVPDPSTVGMVLTSISIVVMLWLGRAKRRLAVALGSRALEADAFQTTACWWLSVAALGGLGLNALWGWWWADPGAAIVMAALIVREGREAWHERDCC